MPGRNRQAEIDQIVQAERAKGKTRTQALQIAMQRVGGRRGGGTTSTPIYDAAVAKAKKKGRKIPTLADQGR